MTIISLKTPAETCAHLGQRARHARLVQNLTQAELAARAGISPGAVRKLESGGQTTLSTFVRVAFALGAANDFEHLLSPQLASIAQMQRETSTASRQRARRAKPVAPRGS